MQALLTRLILLVGLLLSTVPAEASEQQATFAWTHPGTDVGTSGLAGFNIRRCIPSPCTPTTLLTTVSNLTRSYTDLTLASGTGDSYSVNAFDNAGNQSAYTAPVSVTTTGTFKTTLATDNFDRAINTDLGANWDDSYTTETNAQIVSNRVRNTTTNSAFPKAIESYNSVATPNDQWAQVTLANFTGAADTEDGVILRASNPPTDSYYFCFARRNGPVTSRIGTIVNSTTTATTNENATVWASGDKLRCEVEGTTLRLYRIPVGTTNDILVLTTTDSTFSSGKTGVFLWMATGGTLANVELDDFAMGGFGSSVGRPLRLTRSVIPPPPILPTRLVGAIPWGVERIPCSSCVPKPVKITASAPMSQSQR